MKLPHRRQFLHLAVSAAALPAVSRIARAQTYPARPVRIIVGVAAGGTLDILARVMGQWLSERLGQPFIIENRPGASTNIATEAVVKLGPAGYVFRSFAVQVDLSTEITRTADDGSKAVFRWDVTKLPIPMMQYRKHPSHLTPKQP